MVFIMNREGTIVETVTSPVHQGSNANEILLLAPFAPTNTVTVGFKLPNGILIQPRLSKSGTGETMTPLEVNDLFLKVGTDEESMSAWYIKINRDLTRYSGELGIQFFIYDGAGDILASSYATVTVQKGVAILDGTTFDTGTATQLQAALDKVYAALTAVQSNKVDKINTPHALYATDENGEDTFIGFSYDGKPSAGEIPMYMRNGTLPVGMPEADGDAATKSYVDDAKSDAFQYTFDMTAQIDLSYNEEKEELTMTRTVENKVIPLTGVIALKDRVDLLSTLLFNTIITNTNVEDTYTSRVTAGGLPVVSNTPTTVHKIAGETKATENLLDLANKIITSEVYGVTVTANNNNLSFSGTPSRTSFSYLSSDIDLSDYVGKTLTFSQSPTFTAWNSSGAIFWQVYKDGAPIGNSANTDGTLKVDIEEGHAYKARIWQGGSTDAVNETISFMVNEGTTALPYSDYYAGLKNAAFKGVKSVGKNLINQQNILDSTRFAYLQESDLIKRIGTAGANGTVVLETALVPDTYTACVEFIGNAPTSQTSLNVYSNGANIGTIVNSSSIVTNKIYSKSFTSTYPDIQIKYWGAYSDYSFRIWIVRGNSAVPYEKYIEDTSFQLSSALQLRKWDYIDADNQRVVTGTAELTQETAFTDEELATYPAGYILSADRKTIAYPLETPTTAPLTVPKTYTAWRNGSETVDTGEADALPPTITQTYYEEVTA